MSALLVTQPKRKILTPIELPRLRAVSTRSPIDVPILPEVENPRPARLRAVPEMEIAPSEHERSVSRLERLVDALKVGVVIAASVAFAFSLELWLTF